MITRTRNFVIASLVVLAVGLGSGLLAYFVGFPTKALSRLGPDELQFVPADASVVGFADVHSIMASELRQKIRTSFPMKEDGQREFERQTGINIETDIDRIVAAAGPAQGTDTRPLANGIVIARGRFDVVKIEALMRDHGAQVEDYKSVRMLNGTEPQGKGSGSLAFLEPGLIAVGGAPLVHAAVDLKTGGASVTTNDEFMSLVRDLDAGNAWAVGRFDVLRTQAPLPQSIAQSLPAITWFSASGRIDGGIRGALRAETKDEDAANSLRDVVRGAMAFGRLQTSAQPAIQTFLQGLELGGSGKTVSLSFELTPEMLDAFGGMIK